MSVDQLPLSKNCPKVTVITVIFNLVKNGRDKLFRQCVESVAAQSYGNVEHLVIDGGSKDGTVKLLQEYSDKGLIKYISEPDTGIYNAMNKGASLAEGKYLAFLNSDDYWHHKDAIRQSVDALESTQSELSFAPAFYVSEDGYELFCLAPVIGAFFARFPFCHQTMFVSKKAFFELDAYDEQFRSASDYDFIIRYLLSGRSYVKVDLCFTTFRLGGFSEKDQATSIDECAKLLQKNFPDDDMQYDDYRKMYVHCVLPKALYIRIRERVSSRLGEEMDKIITDVLENGEYINCKDYARIIPLSVVAPQTLPDPRSGCKYWFKLFDLIPLYSLTYKDHGKVYGSLFDCIRLFKYQNTHNTIIFRLFGVIPLFRIKKRSLRSVN